MKLLYYLQTVVLCLVGAAVNENYQFSVEPNNNPHSAIPTWGPTFALKFKFFLYSLPNEGEVKELVNIFSADNKQNNDLNFGRFIPIVTVTKINGEVQLVVTTQIGDDSEKTIPVDLGNSLGQNEIYLKIILKYHIYLLLETEKWYSIEILQVFSDTEEQDVSIHLYNHSDFINRI